jgi:hypothetical protein
MLSIRTTALSLLFTALGCASAPEGDDTGAIPFAALPAAPEAEIDVTDAAPAAEAPATVEPPADADADGYSDWTEVTLGSDAADPLSLPTAGRPGEWAPCLYAAPYQGHHFAPEAYPPGTWSEAAGGPECACAFRVVSPEAFAVGALTLMAPSDVLLTEGWRSTGTPMAAALMAPWSEEAPDYAPTVGIGEDRIGEERPLWQVEAAWAGEGEADALYAAYLPLINAAGEPRETCAGMAVSAEAPANGVFLRVELGT